MCDFSLRAVKSRPAKVADKLVVHNFGHGTTGFKCPESAEPVAVCVMPGTEIAFDEPIAIQATLTSKRSKYSVAVFRQINKETNLAHHDALEMPDGTVVLLTRLAEGQKATVLQLPAEPKTEAEAQEQKRLEIVA